MFSSSHPGHEPDEYDTLITRPPGNLDEETFGSTERRRQLEKTLLRKLDLRCAFLVLVYIMNYVSATFDTQIPNRILSETQHSSLQMDRNNAAVARLEGLEEDLHMSGTQFNTLISILYVGYALMQTPSNWFLSRITRPSVYISGGISLWGLISIGTGLSQSYYAALISRFLLGFVEATFFPGVLFLLSRWYTRSELGLRVAILTCGSSVFPHGGDKLHALPVRTLNGSLLSGGCFSSRVQSLSSLLVAAFFIIPDFPSSPARWLTREEHLLAQVRMEEDICGLEQDKLVQSTGHGLRDALTDWKIWWLGISLSSLTSTLSFGNFFPTLCATMGYSPIITLLLCAPPWLTGTATSFLVTRHSDITGDRFWHIAGPMMIGIIGFTIAISTMNTTIRYASFFFMTQATCCICSVHDLGKQFDSRIIIKAGLSGLLSLTRSQRSATWELHTFGRRSGLEEDKEQTTGEWLAVSEFPTTVHVELLKARRIPDPFLGLNEWEVQWIGEADWAFKNSFIVTEKDLATANVDLVFEGLDTFASITLASIVSSLSEAYLTRASERRTYPRFIAYRAPVKPILRVGANALLITFSSAFKKVTNCDTFIRPPLTALQGRQLEKTNGKFHLWNGDSSRLHISPDEVASYGWDWGPILMTIGPWKPIKLHSYDVYLADLDIRSVISEALDVKLTVDLSLSDISFSTVTASVTLMNPQGDVVYKQTNIEVESGHARTESEFSNGELQLWYPVRYGEQPLYTIEVAISDATGQIVDSKTERVAFRRVRVIEEPLIDQPGKTFLFEVNNIRIFCGGSNWIPADSFLTAVTAERYRAWLQLLVDGNQNMIRVWGGGIYEADAFYDTCDELGILVWQDFMFGCGQYPAYDSLLWSIEIEAKQNVKRLRHHPSVVIFAGNNEDYQLAESINIVDYSDETSDFRKTKFPARFIYERTLPSIVSKFCDIHYHRGSPYSAPGVVTTDKTLGDLHQWNVWHGSQEPWHNWDKLAGRFVSEFGMEGYPSIRTIDYWLDGDKTERYPQSRVNNNHNKADGSLLTGREQLYLVENFKHAFDMERRVFRIIPLNAETLASAYRLWRRNWRGKGREYTAGALVWQLNDCWPVTSWAIADYFLRPKPAYFAIARELRSFTVGVTRKEKTTFPDELSAAKFTIETILEVWGTNSTLDERKVRMEVTFFELGSDWTDRFAEDVVLQPNSSTELFAGQLPGQPIRTKLSEVPRVIVASARLLDESEVVLGRCSNWPEPFKFIKFPAAKDLGLVIQIGDDGESVELSTKKPIKGIVLDVEGEDVEWSDQAIDLVPGDPQVIRASGLNGRDVKVRFLGDGTA
ncbi:hypothetical protein JVU11DRAFT_1726 [Chiua virens]|nr:hypothetical protein JVU11DRAFT_1726 [Chiua virens]